MIVPVDKRVIKREDDYTLSRISKPGSTGDTNARKEFGVFTTVKAKIIK